MYATKLSDLNLNKITQELYKLINQKLKDGIDPNNTLLVFKIQEIQDFNKNLPNRNTVAR